MCYRQCEQTYLATLEKKLKAFGQLLIGSFIFWQKFEPTLANFYAIGQINILINGQILKNNLGSYMTDDNI